MRKLPIDLSTFSELIQSGYLYVDKTRYAYNMITGGRRFFLSRPRRFGKSLLISTLQEILTANKALFAGLWIEKSDYQWQTYGIINLDFSKLEIMNLESFNDTLCSHLMRIAHQYNVDIDTTMRYPNLLLENLAYALFTRFGRVAILIDEYDSPILKTLYNEELAKIIRDKIQHFFTTIKSLDAQIQFAFITGVSSFAKAGLFSGINNLQILSLQDNYGTICGYTDEEIDCNFHEHITEWANRANVSYHDLRQQIKKWYNGYHFGENVAAVYNPFSLMNALKYKKFKNFWFQSGTPTFLVEVLKKNEHSFDPEKMTTTEEALGIFDVGITPLTTLMFQAGYLTITGYDPKLNRYTLNYPNEEVRVSFQKYLLEVFAHLNSTTASELSLELREAFEQKDIEKVVSLLYQLFAHVPYQLHISKEKYYHSLFMMICIGAGIKAQSEYSTNIGNIDLVLEFEKLIYVIEIKFNKTAQEAMMQIEKRRYYERFINKDKKLILLGLAFEREPTKFYITYELKEIE